MKYFYIHFFYFALTNQTLAVSSVIWEEVYQDGSIQSGILLFNDSLLRYQYFDK